MQPVKILAIADTHFARKDQELDPRIVDRFDDVDYIVHAGDYAHESLVEILASTGKFAGVYGNMDPFEVRDMVPEINSFQFGDITLGIIHGWGAPGDLVKRIHPLCVYKGFGIVIFGHTHNRFECEYKGIKFYNPGSPVDKMFAKENTFLILTVASKTDIQADFIKL